MIHFKILLIILFSSLFLSASIYENAEDKKVSRWKRLSSDASSRVINRKDEEKKSRIIEFQGEGTKCTYALKIKEKKINNEHWLWWDMKFLEDFVIIIIVNTNRGEHHLIYTRGTFKSHMHYGLGHRANNDEWQTFTRNLQDDISYFDNRIKVISLKSFVVKGNGKIDNIMSRKNQSLPQKIKLKVHKKVLNKIIGEKTNSSPIITVKGPSLIELSLGEKYVEKGVSAYDKEDGEINIKCIENLDNMVSGRYMVLYMATDSQGNMALDKRYVHVGKVELERSIEEEEEETILDDENHESQDNKSKESGMDERSHQIEVWERELKMREKELEQKEKNSNKIWKRD